jgi:hypothetical protein
MEIGNNTIFLNVFAGPSVEVGVSIYVLAVASISEKDMVSFVFRAFLEKTKSVQRKPFVIPGLDRGLVLQAVLDRSQARL